MEHSFAALAIVTVLDIGIDSVGISWTGIATSSGSLLGVLHTRHLYFVENVNSLVELLIVEAGFHSC